MTTASVKWTILVSVVVLSKIQEADGGQAESDLIASKLKGYNPYARPVEDENHALTVFFQVNLQGVADVKEKEEQINTNIWLTIRWSDYRFKWDPLEHNNVSDVRIPMSKIWKPDILLYNSADDVFDSSYPTHATVYSTGVVKQIPPGIFKSSCPIEITWFPFDDQKCRMKFGSWTYDGTKIDLRLPPGEDSAITEEFSPNGEWDLIGMPAVRNEFKYECCPEPYIDLTFTIHLRRRKLYYMVNIVVPCLMLAALTLLTFCIPPDAGEKISFGVTILLSITVFLLLVSEMLPATSDAVPLIAVYFSCVMLMNALSVLFTVIVLVYHHRSSETHLMPKWIDRVCCRWLPYILRMQRPGYDFHKLVWGRSEGETPCESTETMSKCESEVQSTRLLPDNASSGNNNHAAANGIIDTSHMKGIKYIYKRGVTDEREAAAEFNMGRYEQRAILKELKFITDRMKEADKDDQVASDWKFAACVVDRLLLWMFTISTVISTLVCLLSAPNMFTGS